MTATKTLGERVEDLEKRVFAIEQTGTRPRLAVANDEMLDGPWGDPVIKTKSPRDWHGKDYVGYKMSQTEPDYLNLLAGLFEWQAGKDDEAGKRSAAGQLTSGYKRKDAGLARGWARRLAAGWKPAPSAFEKDYAEATQDDKLAAPPDGFAPDSPDDEGLMF